VDISDNLEIDTESQYPQYVPSGYFINEGPKFDVLTDAHANAVLLMVTRNKDVQNSVNSVRRLEDRFNRKRRYPWVFLNSEPWDNEFKKYVFPTYRSLLIHSFRLLDQYAKID
jgi:hypothetical protein